MVKHCAVPKCNSVSGKCDVSFFSIPKKDGTRERWSKILKCSLTVKSFICEKHFRADDVKKSYFSQCRDGTILLDVPLWNKRLRNGAEPIFEMRENKAAHLTTSPSSSSDEDYIEVIDTPPNKIKYMCLTNSQEQNDHQMSSAHVLQNDTTTVPGALHDTDRDSNSPINLQSQNHSKFLSLVKKLYLDEDCYIDLPNEDWIFRKGKNSCTLVFYQIKTYYEEAVSEDFQQADIIKMVSLGGKKKFELIVKHKLLKQNANFFPKKLPSDLRELEEMLRTVDAYNICMGGPPSDVYDSVHSEYAKKDGTNWRHNNCELLVSSGGIICSQCVHLHKRLEQAADRNIKRGLLMRRKSQEKYSELRIYKDFSE